MFGGIMAARVRFPRTIDSDAKDLISRLLVRDPIVRMGFGKTDADAIRRHPFFKAINFDDLMKGKLRPPYQPKIVSQECIL